MGTSLLKDRLAQELPEIAAGLNTALRPLPEPCLPVARHILDAGGKRLRPFLVILFAGLFGRHDESVYPLAASMELLHAATLLHDDVLDNAELRRKRKAAHMLFGTGQTILAGDALLACGNAAVASCNMPELCTAYSRATMVTASGEIAEIASLGRPDATFADYVAIASAKTGCLIAESCALGAIYAGAAPGQVELARKFGENLGLGFQIVDDCLDFAPEEQTGKPCGGDLREGKATPPLILYRSYLQGQAKDEFDSSFGKFSQAEAAAIIAGIQPLLQESLALADQYLDLARDALSRLPDAPEKAILAEMPDFVRNRQA